ncbi:MAG: signal peptidase I [Patescibacteria group bacterium]|nr:signal peptidase I [Patescibacteria group bacterium]
MLKKVGTIIFDLLEILFFAISIFLFVYLLIMQPHRIKGTSMYPNLHDGEYLLSDKISYKFRNPARGEIIVFKAPGSNGEEFIKRIIGLPGEEIGLKDGKYTINGKTLNESYLPSDLVTNGGNFLSEGETVLIPENNYFVSGDNRPLSSDSRAWGFVEKDKITGKAWFIYWPLESIGTIKKVKYNF